jgi:hypothetical protein
MWVQYRGDDEEAIDEYIRAVAKDKMMEEDGLDFSGGFAKLTYVGNRKEIQVKDTTPERQIDPNKDGWSTGLLAAVVSGSFLVVLFMGLFTARKHRKRHDDQDKMMTLPDVICSMDLETGSSSEDELSSSHEKSDGVDSENPMSMWENNIPLPLRSPSEEVVTAESGQLNVDHDSQIRVEEDASVDSSALNTPIESMKIADTPTMDSKVEKTSNTSMIANGTFEDNNVLAFSSMPILPPLPPAMRRNSSQKLKTKRKKKKKKKRKVLQRVSSKELISGMETIQESDDEESEYSSEGGSEFSTDDEGRHSRSSSACTTPTRPRPNASVQQLSHIQISPRGELFSSDVFADASFEDYDVSSHDCATVEDSIIMDLRKELGLEDGPNTSTGSTEIPIQDDGESSDRRVWYLSADGDEKLAL